MTPPEPPRGNRPITERNPATGRAIGGRTTMPPQQWPAAEPTGDLGSAPALPKTPAEYAYAEGQLLEMLVAQERRLMARIDTAIGAQNSAELTIAHRRNRRLTGLAVTLGTAAGLMLVMFTTAWSVYRDYRAETTSQAAAAAVEAVAPTVAPTVAPLAQRVDETAARLDDVDERLDRLDARLARVLELLEGGDERRRPR